MTDFPDQVIKVWEFSKINEILEDKDVEKTLNKVVELIGKPELPASLAIPLIVRLQALSFKFKAQGKFYMHSGKTQERASEKKNYYLMMADETDKLASALKYVTKTY